MKESIKLEGGGIVTKNYYPSTEAGIKFVVTSSESYNGDYRGDHLHLQMFIRIRELEERLGIEQHEHKKLRDKIAKEEEFVGNLISSHDSLIFPETRSTGPSITKLEFFAAQAPKEIPEWFQHKPRKKPEGYEKVCRYIPIAKDSDKPTEEEINQYNEYNQQNSIDRAVQWPWFWAQAVLDQQDKAFAPQFNFHGNFSGVNVGVKITIDSDELSESEKMDCAKLLMGNYWAQKKEEQ